MRRAGPALIACVALAVGIAACGDDDGETEGASPTQPVTTETPPAEASPSGGGASSDEADGERAEEKDAESESEPALSPAQRAAARTVRDYVHALDGRNGNAVCALLSPGALDAVKLPKQRGDCAASLEASIGYRDPRGLPVWETARVAELQSVEVSGDSAKVVATTVTQFADRDEPSIEDDVVYVVRSGDDWLIAKASSTLYRAVGIADVPPSVLAPPG
jgi:hypothetical protein